MTLMFIGTFNEPEQLEPPEPPEKPVSQTSTKKHSIPLVGEKDPMNPHARSATARCWSSPAGEGVLLVLSLARMRYGSPVMPWIGRYYAFCFWWLVTRDWWPGGHSSFVICRFSGNILDTVPEPYPTWYQVERMKSIEEMISFSIC